MNLDKSRFAPNKGTFTPNVDIHESLFLRKNSKKIGANFFRWRTSGDITKLLNVVGEELWMIVFVTAPDDPLHIMAKAALTGGDIDSYRVMLDMLEEQGVLTEEEIAQSRKAASLWGEGHTNQKLENKFPQCRFCRRSASPPSSNRLSNLTISF